MIDPLLVLYVVLVIGVLVLFGWLVGPVQLRQVKKLREENAQLRGQLLARQEANGYWVRETLKLQQNLHLQGLANLKHKQINSRLRRQLKTANSANAIAARAFRIVSLDSKPGEKKNV